MGDEELSLAELGRRLGVSRERARQLEARAKRKLRRELQGLEQDAA
jgi:RNA polymerase sigma-32 factor